MNQTQLKRYIKQVLKKDKTYQSLKHLRSSRREIYSSVLTLDVALKEQISLKDEIGEVKESTKPKNLEKKKIKNRLLETQLDFLMEDEKFLMVSKAKYFQCKTRHKEKNV